jgi:hypothetical protein
MNPLLSTIFHELQTNHLKTLAKLFIITFVVLTLFTLLLLPEPVYGDQEISGNIESYIACRVGGSTVGEYVANVEVDVYWDGNCLVVVPRA